MIGYAHGSSDVVFLLHCFARPTVRWMSVHCNRLTDEGAACKLTIAGISQTCIKASSAYDPALSEKSGLRLDWQGPQSASNYAFEGRSTNLQLHFLFMI